MAQRRRRDQGNGAAAAVGVLAPEGGLSRVLPRFEARPQQLRMAEVVSRVLTEGGVGLVEAGTGTGKSLAYLTPAALHAAGSGRRVIVSTHTHPLQEQLLEKDIPTLQAALVPPPSATADGNDAEAPVPAARPFSAATMKGWTNYLCLWRLEQAGAEAQSLFPEDRRALKALARWAEGEDHGGTREEVDFPVAEETWLEVQAESDTCLRLRCPFYDDCFYFRARRRAQRADIVIANHHLVCADFAVRRQVGWDADVGVLPGANHYIFDEAHHLEDVFTEHFGLVFSRLRVHRLLRRVESKTGLIPRLQRFLGRRPGGADAESLASATTADLPRAVVAVQSESDGFFGHVASVAAEKSGPERGGEAAAVPLRRGEVEARFWQPLGTALEGLQKVLARVAEKLREGADEEGEGAALGWEADALARRAEAAAADLIALAEADDDRFVYWLAPQKRRRREWILRGAPVEIGPVVQQTLLEHAEAVVMTSATLSAGDRFQYFMRRLGLEGWPAVHVEPPIPSPFDYERQVLLCVTDALPAPDRADYWARLPEALQKWLDASRGRAFVLFTSYRDLRAVHDALQPWLLRRGMTGLRQGDGSRAHLLERFRREPRPVLFGTDSFWEGVDVPGQALSLVVVTRLPFRVPTDPVATARRRALRERGLDPFAQLTVPQAVMRLRQGFGRLIRTAEDRGAVVIADRRILDRAYGRRFLHALPKTARHRGDPSSVAEALSEWIR